MGDQSHMSGATVLRGLGALVAVVVMAGVAVAQDPFGDRGPQSPTEPFRPARGAHLVEGVHWYRRHLISDLKSLLQRNDELQRSLAAGTQPDPRTIRKLAGRISGSARSAWKNVRAGAPSTGFQPISGAGDDSRSYGEHAVEVDRLVRAIVERVARESATNRVDVAGRGATLDMLRRLDGVAQALRRR